MVPVAKCAATAVLAGAAVSLALVFCSPAGADPATSAPTEPVSTPMTASTTTSTSARPAPPVTTPKTRRIVLIGTAASVQSSSASLVGVQAVGVPVASGPAVRTLPHTGSPAGPLTLLGFALVLLGSLALRGQHPQLRLSERS